MIALTQSGSLLGTQPYLAPEQFQGKPVTPAVDLWALGVTLYELAEGHRPFRADTPEALMRAILDDPIPAPVHGLPLAPLIAALLTKDPSARPDAHAAATILTSSPPAAVGAHGTLPRPLPLGQGQASTLAAGDGSADVTP